MAEPSPVLDLACLTLEVMNLEKAETFYCGLLGLTPKLYDPECGTLELLVNAHQTLRFWKPITRQHNNSRLSALGARGGTHVHYALQIPRGSRQNAQNLLTMYGVAWQEIDLAAEGEESDLGTYFFDPFGHGLELREVTLESGDPRRPLTPPGAPREDPRTIPVVGLREVALAYTDFAAMLERLPQVYGFAFAEQMEDRAFGQFTLAESSEKDGHFTPRRWLYCWDPQVGLADMLGGEHATVGFYADLDPLERRVRASGQPHFRDAHSLVVCDAEGHVFEFFAAPERATL